MDEGLNSRKVNMMPRDAPSEHEAVPFDKPRSRFRSFHRTGEKPGPSDRVFTQNQRLPSQAHPGEVRFQSNNARSNYNSFQGNELPKIQLTSKHIDVNSELSHDSPYMDTPVRFLQEISKNCGSKIEFRSDLLDTAELQFSIEVWFVGEKIGEGIGRTRKEAQHHAAENSLQNLANKYLSNTFPDATPLHGDPYKSYHWKEDGFASDLNSLGYSGSPRDEFLLGRGTPQPHIQGNDGSKRTASPVAALKELVDIAGQVLGKGVGLTWDEAKIQAAEEALEALKSMPMQVSLKGSGSLRSMSFNKRLKQDLSLPNETWKMDNGTGFAAPALVMDYIPQSLC
ncbi:hypothetical protein HPP92_007340 [Vanilla planifolia]|uniref:DRBM domain-containing protein n=1 Tax=Vanilla planifolia TaxID=51239 RepID=A0A835V5S9_VANPL|nr:hypothetical protein HPP92_007340 [Vanilla planifolia]